MELNSLKARLEKVEWWLARARPDVLLLQEPNRAGCHRRARSPPTRRSSRALRPRASRIPEDCDLVLPADSPNLNAFAERFLRSICEDCLHHVVPLGERHLRSVVTEYVEHYHTERNRQGLANELIASSVAANTNGPVQRRERLGGLLSYHHRAAV